MDLTIKRWLFALFCFGLSVPLHSADDPLKSAVDSRLKAQKRSLDSQEQIDALADETRDIFHEYRSAIRSSESLKVYNEQLAKLTTNQKEKLDSIQRQLDSIEETQRDIVPLMLKMIRTLEEFISLDMPFLTNERQTRLAAIKEMMDRPDVTLPDKFRRIMQAYQIEIEYGRTIEAYTDTIKINGSDNTVDILRIGRVSMMYVSLDNEQSGYWNKQSQSWQSLEGDYLRSLQAGIKIARKQSSPDLFSIPVTAPEKVK